MSTTPTKTEDKVVLQRELAAMKQIHDALLSIAPGRRTAVLKSVCILLDLSIPQD